MFVRRAYVLLPKTATPVSPRMVMMRPGVINPEKITMIDAFGFGLIKQKVT